MIKRNRTIRQTEGAQEGQGVFWKSKQLLVLCFFLRQILGYNGIAFGIYRQYYGNYKPIANFVQPTFRLPVHTCLFHATTWILCSMKMRMRKSNENFNIITTALVLFFFIIHAMHIVLSFGGIQQQPMSVLFDFGSTPPTSLL